MSCTRNITNGVTDNAMPNLLIIFANLSSCMARGVFTFVVSALLQATLPISVLSPTAVTRYSPLPFITIVLRSTWSMAYVLSSSSLLSLPPTLFSAIGSPVSEDSSTCKLTAFNSCPSAGISSPVSINTISPTTISRRGISIT